MSATAVILPQCLGAWFASTAIYLLYSGIAGLRQKPVQHAVIRPAFASGCLWAVGFLFMIKGIHEWLGCESCQGCLGWASQWATPWMRWAPSSSPASCPSVGSKKSPGGDSS